MAATDALPPPVKTSNKFLLFLPEGEWHDTSLLFASYIIRSRGYNAYYFGQNIKYELLSKVVASVAPKYLLLFYISGRPKEEIESQVNAMSKSYKGVKILVAGNTQFFPEQQTRVKNITYLKGVQDLMEFVG